MADFLRAHCVAAGTGDPGLAECPSLQNSVVGQSSTAWSNIWIGPDDRNGPTFNYGAVFNIESDSRCQCRRDAMNSIQLRLTQLMGRWFGLDNVDAVEDFKLTFGATWAQQGPAW